MKMKRKLLIPVLTAIGSSILLTVISCSTPMIPDLTVGTTGPAETAQSTMTTGAVSPGTPSTSQPTVEPTGSPVDIIIYTDFQCGACAKFNSEIEPELRRRYESTGRVNIEIRVLGALSEDSVRAAEAALYAQDQGKFLEFKDALFQAWSESEDTDIFSVEALAKLAASLGIDETSLASSLKSGAKRAEVEANMKLAQKDGVHTLPTLIIGNTKIQGKKPLDTYTQAIEKALSAR